MSQPSTSTTARTPRPRRRRPGRRLGLAASAVVLAAPLAGCSLAERVSDESQQAAADATATPTPTPTPTSTPTATASATSEATDPSSPTASPTATPSSTPSASPSASPTSSTAEPSDAASEDPAEETTDEPDAATQDRLDALSPGDFFVDDTRLRINGVCRTGSNSFELFLQDGSRFYFDLLRDGSAIKDGQVFDPASFEDIRQVAPLAPNRGEAPRVRVAGVEMRSDAGYSFDAAFLVTTANRDFCGE